ncbi:SAM domain-containing protein SAMSN-1b isoform X1 [Misgurnus anguillicaudatus]|uniref:SAM domain-containing protein SAMSN-1b isoform X1 n=1 Tax=Misgurnus anguillicaudatus TaxID=75329 RepID=UPI003CCF3A34
MNLFCFTLDGSTDSLYEPTQSVKNSQDLLHKGGALPRMPCSPRAVSGSETIMKLPKTATNKIHLEKAKRKSQIITASEDEASDHPEPDDSHGPTTKKKDRWIDSQNDFDTETVKDQHRLKLFLKDENDETVCLEESLKNTSVQGVNFEAWNPNRENPDGRQPDLIRRTEGEEEAQGTLKRIQKLVGVKKGTQISTEDSRNKTDSSGGHMTESEGKDNSPVITCISLTKKTEKKPTTCSTRHSQQSQKPLQRKDVHKPEASWSPGLFQEYWSPIIYSPAWDTATHTCHRSTAEQVMYNFNFTLPRATDWDKYEELFHQLDPYKRDQQARWITHSVIDLDMADHVRSTSFGIFDRQQPAQVKAEDKKDSLPVETESPEVDSSKSGGLGKKMKTISLTMRKKMGRKYTKALSEEMGEEPAAGEVGNESALAKDCSQSVESLFSLHSGQSSSSGVTSSSDGYSNRDSLRLDDDVPYTGQFCGRAKVHTDFVPSPYDTESLKLKVGNVIDIISKSANGIWTGMLNGKVGNFKFIYVDVLVEESVPEPRIRPHRKSKRPRPKTLQELLERLNLEEHISSLLLNGYQTVEDLRDLKEQHLIELNVTDPEHRERLLAAAENLQDTEYNKQSLGQADEPKSPSEHMNAELNDCPRDSGCFTGSDCSENIKEDTENQLASLSPSTAES